MVSQEFLLAGLGVLSVANFAVQARLTTGPRGGLRFDADYAIVVLALAVGGPLPAFLIWAGPEFVGRFFMRDTPVFSPGSIATIGSFAIGTVLGAHLFAIADGGSHLELATALFAAGIVIWLVNALVTGPLYALVCENRSNARALAHVVIVDLGPLSMAIVGIGVLGWLALPVLGLGSVALLAIASLLPQFALIQLTRERSVATMDQMSATKLFAAALADVLALSRSERSALELAAELPQQEAGDDPHAIARELAQAALALGDELSGGARRGSAEAWLVAARASDRFDGADWPAGTALLVEPRAASMVLSCARGWAGLTAAGSLGLSHEQALLGLATSSGHRYDPHVIDAAYRVVHQEASFLREPAFQPSLHTLPLPRRVRRVHLPAVLGRLAAA